MPSALPSMKSFSFFSRKRHTERGSSSEDDADPACIEPYEDIAPPGLAEERYTWTYGTSSQFRNEKAKKSKGKRSAAEPGMLPEIGQLYREREEDPWDEWMPENADRDLEETSAYKKFAMIVRREKKRGKAGLALHSIVIQSPLLRKVLDVAFDGYDGISTKLKTLKLYAPMHEFYFCWHRFEKLCHDEKDTTTKDHIDLLFQTVHQEISPHIEAMEDLTQNGVITFEYLWAMFPPGLQVYSKIDDQDRVFSFQKGYYGQDPSGARIFSLECRYIDCDGTQFGYVTTSLKIHEFSGTTKIADLAVCPVHLHPDSQMLLDRLIRRGERFESLNGFHHVAYSGYYISKARYEHRKRHVCSTSKRGDCNSR